MGKAKEYKGTAENEVFAMRLNDAIIDSGLTREKLHKKSGLSIGAIASYIDGTKAPSYLAFRQLAEALGVSYEYLYGEVSAKKPRNKEISKALGLDDGAIEWLEITCEEAVESEYAWARAEANNVLKTLNFLIHEKRLDEKRHSSLLSTIAYYFTIEFTAVVDKDKQPSRLESLFPEHVVVEDKITKIRHPLNNKLLADLYLMQLLTNLPRARDKFKSESGD